MSAGQVKKKIALIGKGLTFDSGGYNLKVGGLIELMKFDMGGAAAVLGAAQIISDLKPEGVEVCAQAIPAYTPARHHTMPPSKFGNVTARRHLLGHLAEQGSII